jgi:flagellar motor switch protein FliG
MSKDDARPNVRSPGFSRSTPPEGGTTNVRASVAQKRPPADDGIRKTAILIESLDQPTAEVLFGQLSLDLAAQVRAALLELGEVDPQERAQVLAEFLNAGSASDTKPEEIGLDPAAGALAEDLAADSAAVVVPMLEEASRQAAGNQVEASLRNEESCRQAMTGLLSSAVDHRLERESPPAAASTAALARGLTHEHAQTICLVMAHLSPRQAADLLQRLAPARQAEVLRRLGQLETAAPEVLRGLGEALQPWGFAAPGEISAVPGRSPSVEPSFPAGTGPGRGQEAAGRTRPRLHTGQYPDRPTACAAESGEAPSLAEFDDLVRLDDAALARVFGAAEPETVLLALSGANRDLIDRIVRHLPSAAGRTLRRQLESLGPTRLRDIELAQQQLAELAGQMCRQGLIHVPSRRRFTMAA